MTDPGIRAHQEWLGLIQPVGLVVVPSALVAAQVELDRSQSSKWLDYDALLVLRDNEQVLPEWPTFARAFLEWTPSQLAGAEGGPTLPAELSVVLPELDATIQPTYAVPDPHRDGEWLLLVSVQADDVALDRSASAHGTGWNASPHDRFERLLRETGVPAGLLVSGDVIRFIYAPRGESSGWLNFPVESMATPSGRPMLSALYELLKGWRLSRACPEARGLRRLLEESRKYQNEVSTRLSEQVLASLYEMARGFQAADDAAPGTVLHDTLRQAPSEVYGGLLTTIMRLVFVLYAEERGMLPQDAVWVEHYGVGSLLERLRGDRSRYPDTMDQRYGAWPRLLSLFRILHDGANHDSMVIPSRAGELFDPDRYPFLEGRPFGTHRVMGERLTNLPRVSDGTMLRVLERLLMLDEERLSYRALDVEQIGSVYEAMMGFEALAARGASIAVRPKTKKAGSPSHSIVDLDRLLAQPAADRIKWLKEDADCELPPADAAALNAATSIDALLAALGKRISPFTPQPIRQGGLVLSPTEERRRSGSHYTPRELTEPIVATTLRPVLEAFGETPTPEQLLELRICDPAMGSGAFLVGACRYLGDKLVESWQRTNTMPAIPPDEDPQLYARRIVAQRCLYGVDRNPFAVQLAKLSLWLVTLAREHPFTFLDHALRGGDSLVGLSAKQIAAFHWSTKAQISLWGPTVATLVGAAVKRRSQIESLAGTDDTALKLRLLGESDDALQFVRLVGDAVIAAYFSEEKEKKREQLRQQYEQSAQDSVGKELNGGSLEAISERLRNADQPITPFHWDVEFAEVFGRPNPGFDAIVGNPPFLGGKRISTANGGPYRDWLSTIHEGASGNTDLVAHFFRRAFSLLNRGGTFGLIATNTIAQGDTRVGGLAWLCEHGCTVYEARKRLAWPGHAAVVVSVVYGSKSALRGPFRLNGKLVDRISAFLFHAGGNVSPQRLVENAGKSFNGSFFNGVGFTFDDANPDATPISDIERLCALNPRNREVIVPFIGGEELNESPRQMYHRYVINFADMEESEARMWPELLAIVEAKVRPHRMEVKRESHRQRWWQFGEKRLELYSALRRMERVLVNSQVSTHFAFAFQPTDRIFSHALNVLLFDKSAGFAVLQSRAHEIWARFLGSSMKDDLRYTPSECFETFPFPVDWEFSKELDRAGIEYYDYRARFMSTNHQGLTATYNRFHDRDEQDPGIRRLREVHDEMDRAVLTAYGWTDLQPTCEFLLDYDDDEEDTNSRRRKPWRYRWPDEIRDEVLARLMELNRQRSTQPPARQQSLF
ncbi:MAG: DNA methyltransferase [Gemmatimonadota bacterium]